ncbi:MAG: rod-binding protein [Endozoicomonas sp.]
MISTINPLAHSNVTANVSRQAPEDLGDLGDLESAAKAFESLFVNELLKGMRKANEALMAGNDDLPMMGDDVRFFYSMFDAQLAQHLSSNDRNGKGGLGIAQALIRQLGDQGFENPTSGAKEAAFSGRWHSQSLEMQSLEMQSLEMQSLEMQRLDTRPPDNGLTEQQQGRP